MITLTTLPNDVYKVCDGTYYHRDTDDRVIEILEMYRARRLHPKTNHLARLIITYGDPRTCKPFEDKPERGTIGRSTGTVPIPLLIKTKRSFGGAALLTDCIIKIQSGWTKQTLYNKSGMVLNSAPIL